MNHTLLKYEESSLFIESFVIPNDLKLYNQTQSFVINEVLRDFKSRMYDIHFEIIDLVEKEIKILKEEEEIKLRKIVFEAERRQLMEQGYNSPNLTLLK